ncbi:TIGR04282 family arsenosugar biosynthesis glycosyltransferase [Futiania mangrovi]|uniref:TIGR04282 family arsenosugar biosynthesis glycosyltransferase n=1 Tax=Futiania mangrovi TaxID=2959716 RepID=A0A9J6PFT3_9PROT|nr:TIGR04282 family arsenosugar biosynthesis glycosyltransferase [Futiania mangrovii]MCP1337577.1 TIGR04282 family arsenosugar biosynthesis glycosyltransferase [Futiania mangrovii]
MRQAGAGTLVIFARAAVAGRAKTRLARHVGYARAAMLSRLMTLASVQRLSAPGRWRTLVAVTPDGAAVRGLPGLDARHVRQGQGDLGHRMQRAFSLAGQGPVVIVGTDIPGIRRHHVAAAFRALGRAEVAVGPSGDGGYWMVGQRCRPRTLTLFQGVRWSGPHALADTLANLPDGARAAYLPVLTDIDEGADWLAFTRAGGRIAP